MNSMTAPIANKKGQLPSLREREDPSLRSQGWVRSQECPHAVVTADGAATGAGDAATFLAATAFLATALTFFFAAFLPADFTFRPLIAFFCIELRFVATVLPPREHVHLGPGPSYAY
jgi:hypothetical protein